MDWGAWWAAVHGVAKSWTRLSDFTYSLNMPTAALTLCRFCRACLPSALPGGGSSLPWVLLGARKWLEQGCSAFLSADLIKPQIRKGFRGNDYYCIMLPDYELWDNELTQLFLQNRLVLLKHTRIFINSTHENNKTWLLQKYPTYATFSCKWF